MGRDGGPGAAGPHPARAAGRRHRALHAPRDAGAGLALRERLAGRRAGRAPRGSSFDRDPREAVAALATVAPDDRLVVFVGKLIASKGVELLLAAWPLVLAREPRARLVIVGFGAFRAGLEALAAALAAGDLDAAGATRGEDGRELPAVRRIPAAVDATPALRIGARARSPGGSTHGELADLLPAAEAMAMTSTFPEAFGMVAAEAAACGALPVVANHSGLGEVARTLREAVPGRRAPGCPSSSARSRWPSSPTRCRAGWPRRTTSGPRPARDRRGDARPLLLGRGRRAPSSPPRGASWTRCRSPY